MKGQRNAKRNLRFTHKENNNERKSVVGGQTKSRKRSSQGLHVVNANRDVDFVNSTNNSSKFGKSERLISTNSKVFNGIHSVNKKRTNLNKSIKNEYVKGNGSFAINESHRHRAKHLYKPQQTNWPSMIRTGSYGYDVPLPTNLFSVKISNTHSFVRPYN